LLYKHKKDYFKYPIAKIIKVLNALSYTHYIRNYNSGNIFILTYDAWIHSMLLLNKVHFINNEFEQKCKLCKELNPKCYSSIGKKN
jgi:hypothetical protein